MLFFSLWRLSIGAFSRLLTILNDKDQLGWQRWRQPLCRPAVVEVVEEMVGVQLSVGVDYRSLNRFLFLTIHLVVALYFAIPALAREWLLLA
jgi:hypothetical protein